MPPFIRRRVQRTIHAAERKLSRFSLRLHAPMLFLGGILLLLTLAWSFFVGFLVGRGENPGEKLAQYDPFTSQVEESDNSAAAKNSKFEEQQKDKKDFPVIVAREEQEKEKKTLEASNTGRDDLEQKKKRDLPHPFARPNDASKDAWGAKEKEKSPPSDLEKKAEPEKNGPRAEQPPCAGIFLQIRFFCPEPGLRFFHQFAADVFGL
ncbi:MAG: hypothetical protein J5803_02525, partial [Desulfovibrio sp.]|nr:hypothetical protein [Desulfovibrio sp.]